MNHNDYTRVDSCDKCPLQSEGGCQHPNAPKEIACVNGLTEYAMYVPHPLCPLRTKPLVLSLVDMP